VGPGQLSEYARSVTTKVQFWPDHNLEERRSPAARGMGGRTVQEDALDGPSDGWFVVGGGNASTGGHRRLTVRGHSWPTGRVYEPRHCCALCKEWPSMPSCVLLSIHVLVLRLFLFYSIFKLSHCIPWPQCLPLFVPLDSRQPQARPGVYSTAPASCPSASQLPRLVVFWPFIAGPVRVVLLAKGPIRGLWGPATLTLPGRRPQREHQGANAAYLVVQQHLIGSERGRVPTWAWSAAV